MLKPSKYNRYYMSHLRVDKRNKRYVVVATICLICFVAGALISQSTASVPTVTPYVHNAPPVSIYDRTVFPFSNGTYGYVGDMTTNSVNSASSSQTFINAVNNCVNGGSVFVANGTYTVDATWLIQDANNVKVAFDKGAKLVAANGLNSAVLAVWSSNNIMIDGVTIDGNAANQVQDINNIVSGGVTVASLGLFIGDNVNTGCSNVMVQNSVIYNVREFGVYIGFASNIHCGVKDSTIYNCGWNGFTSGTGSVKSFCVNTEIYNCSDVGISTYSTNDEISANYVHDLNIFIGGSGGVGIGSQWAIGVEGGSGQKIINNIVARAVDGIFNAGFNNCTISGNTIDTISDYSLMLNSGSTSNIVDSNIITTTTAAGSVGISLVGAKQNLITKNVISKCVTSGIQTDAASTNNTISLNNILQLTSSSYGLNLAGNNTWVQGNTIQTLNNDAISSTGRRCTFLGNTITAGASSGYGLNIGSSVGDFAQGNRFQSTYPYTNSTAFAYHGNMEGNSYIP